MKKEIAKQWLGRGYVAITVGLFLTLDIFSSRNDDVAYYGHTANKTARKVTLLRSWTDAEDEKILRAAEDLKGKGERGGIDWKGVSQRLTGRTPRQCRDRYYNYLRDTGDGRQQQGWTKEGDAALWRLYTELGGKWKVIAKYFPGRTDVGVKQRYFKVVRKKPLSELEEDASGLKSNIKLWIETNAKEGASSNQGRPQSRQSVPLGPETPKLTVMIGKSANIPVFSKETTKIQNITITSHPTISIGDPSMILLNTIAQQNAAQEAKKVYS